MPDNEVKNHIVSYDIADPKRLIHVNKIIKNYGISLQYSVFLVPMKKKLLNQLITELESIIDPKEDDIRIYPLPKKSVIEVWGKQKLPDGIFIDSFNSLRIQYH